MRKLALLFALVSAMGVFAVSASGATAGEVGPEPGVSATEEGVLPTGNEPGVGIVLMSPAQMSPLAISQCPANAVCAWEARAFEGNFSWFAASETGCHPHPGLPEMRSGYNNTHHTVFYGPEEIKEGVAWNLEVGKNPIVGQICWE
jgi:hypothetical protein